MEAAPDLVALNSQHEPIAVIEVKAIRRPTTARWATDFRDNLRSHSGFQRTRFFLIVTPQKIFLWDRDSNEPQPQVIDAHPHLKEGFEQSGVRAEAVRGYAFELLVEGWLTALTMAPASEQQEGPLRSFAEAIRGGRIDYPAAA
jgi:hypothetical protein